MGFVTDLGCFLLPSRCGHPDYGDNHNISCIFTRNCWCFSRDFVPDRVGEV